MTTALITYRGTVYPWHCDHVGHMNVMWYVGKFDEATWQLFNAVGLTPHFLRTARRCRHGQNYRAGDQGKELPVQPRNVER